MYISSKIIDKITHQPKTFGCVPIAAQSFGDVYKVSTAKTCRQDIKNSLNQEVKKLN